MSSLSVSPKPGVHASIWDMTVALLKAVMLVSPRLVNHQKRVALTAGRLARSLGDNEAGVSHVVLAGLLHDIGCLSVEEQHTIQRLDRATNCHAEIGARVLAILDQFGEIAELVRAHHAPAPAALCAPVGSTPFRAALLRMADYIDFAIDPDIYVLEQAAAVRARVEQRSDLFPARAISAFLELSRADAFWLDVHAPGELDGARCLIGREALQEMKIDDLRQMALVFALVIDMRSHFTLTHSFGVAASAAALATYRGVSPRTVELIEVASYLHDIGKLAIDSAILEKNGALTATEMSRIKSHSYHSFTILNAIPGFEQPARWAAYHHEDMVGGGYPFAVGAAALDQPARILAVADKFVALAEDRPYRPGMPQAEVLRVLDDLAAKQKVDPAELGALKLHYAEIDTIRRQAQDQEKTIQRYLLKSEIVDIDIEMTKALASIRWRPENWARRVHARASRRPSPEVVGAGAGSHAEGAEVLPT
ncbi:MAG: HD domain-containing protein [Alphaproteobacteria bacterium]|nr:HD domain-containing protein [Alphaproteobacteria bacterium]